MTSCWLAPAARRQQRRRRRAPGYAVLLLAAFAGFGALTGLVYIAVPQSNQAVHLQESEHEVGGSAEEARRMREEPSPAYCARADTRPPLVCAHGGDASSAPPNTRAAFRAALDAGAPCLEVDVARTRDGVLVVLHTRELSQLLQLPQGAAALAAWQAGGGAGRGRLLPQAGDFSWAQLQRLRWESGEGIERVDRVLALALPRAEQVTLDLKPYTQAGEEVDGEELAQQVADLIAQAPTPGCGGAAGALAEGQGQRCLVWAKSDWLVGAVKALAPGVRVGYVVINETQQARDAGMHQLLRLPEAEVVALHHAMASPALIQQARAAGKEVHAWTANTAEMMARVLDAGVDAVVTNHPRRLLEALGARALACARRRRRLAE